MPPVTIKTPELIDGLWFSQLVLVIIIVSAWVLVPWPWLALSVLLFPVMFFNHRAIIKNQTGAVWLNARNQWYWLQADEMYPCPAVSHWHMAGFLWLRLESEQTQHHCLIMKNRVGGENYAQLLMAVNQNEQQTQ